MRTVPLVIVCCACAPAEPVSRWAGTIDTLPDGKVRVTNPAEGVWTEGEGWRLDPDLALGEVDGAEPFVFGVIAGMQVGEDGRIYVVDRQANELRIFSPEGHHIRSVGRTGRGPGEYQNANGLLWLDDDTLVVVDQRGERYTILTREGDYVRYAFLFRENITVGAIDQRHNYPRMREAARRSLADTIATRLENGYEQQLGRRFDGGVDLSGGEWQKLALARAYFRGAQVLILDEPTASLDARAEYEVFQRFADVAQSRLAVLISHRFSTVRMADRILVLRNGRLVEHGRHQDLVRNAGLYAELFSLQAAAYR